MLRSGVSEPGPPKEPKLMAQYLKIETIGSIGSIILAILEVEELEIAFQATARSKHQIVVTRTLLSLSLMRECWFPASQRLGSM